MNQIDFLTGLYTVEYLQREYQIYRKEHPNAKVIAIDFHKMKYINDNFGHDVGDECLKLFGTLSKIYFKDALLIRRSGDEFLFITDDSDELIAEKIDTIHLEICRAHENNLIPTKFTVNCGVTKAEENLKDTLIKADAIMYQAKINNVELKFYEEELYIQYQNRVDFIEKIDRLVKEQKIQYVGQRIFKLDKTMTPIIEIYARDTEGKSIYEEEYTNILRLSYRFKKIDWQNIEKLFANTKQMEQEKLMINVHYQTLLAREKNFTNFMNGLINKYQINPHNYLLSINILGYYEDISKLIQPIKELQQLGFPICLDSLKHGNLILNFMTDCEVEYVKIKHSFWKDAMSNPRKAIILKKMIECLVELKAIPIFVSVETKEEVDFINSLYPNCYAKGYFYQKEQKINT